VLDTHVACMNTASLMRETRFTDDTDDALFGGYTRRKSVSSVAE